MNRVSVVVTCFNYGRYLPGCLRSVLAQTRPWFEITVVDDGSTDDTAEVVKPFLADPRIRYEWQANAGQASAKNTGARLSSGDLIAYLDADDQWAPEKLAKQVPLFDNPQTGVVFSGMDVIDDADRIVACEEPSGYWAYRRGAVLKWLVFDNFVPFSSVIVRRELLEAYGGFDETLRMGIDWDLWLRLSPVTEFDYVPERLLRYRRGHANQMSRNWDGRIAAADIIFNRFLAQHPDVLTEPELRRVRLYNACSRAAGYRGLSFRKALHWILEAVRLAPASPVPYVAFARQLRWMVRGS